MRKIRTITVPPVGIALLYGTFVALGVVAFILGVPTFDLTFNGAFAAVWGVVMVIAALSAMFGLLSGHERTEKDAVLTIALLLAMYLGSALHLISQGGEDARSRGAFGVVLLLVMWFPVVQYMRLRKGSGASERR